MPISVKRRIYTFVFLFVSFWIIDSSWASEHNTVLSPRKINHQPNPDLFMQRPKPEPLRSMVSQKNLLGLERETPYGLPKAGSLALETQSDSIHILVFKSRISGGKPR
jgi:hypothetical protein